MTQKTELTHMQQVRQHAMKVMAKSSYTDLQSQWDTLNAEQNITLDYSIIKPAEVGMTMVRAQAGEGGVVYNQGEMTVTRCVVQDKQTKLMGVGYTQGRNKQKAELMAVLDTLVQSDSTQRLVLEHIITPLQAAITNQENNQEAATQSTRVDFFTMVRGE